MTETAFTDLFDFDGKVVVVTGAANGIGAATARRFAELGAATAAFGRIDVLVNGAGIFPHQRTLDMSGADWDAVMGLNLRASFLTAQACAQVMTEPGGAIVNISSRGAWQPRPDMVAYATSKGGVVSLTRALAMDLGPSVRVNAVAPGPISDTKGAQALMPADDEAAAATLAAYGSGLPLGRTGRADEVARLIVFLASDAASFITGEIVSIDGGRSIE